MAAGTSLPPAPPSQPQGEGQGEKTPLNGLPDKMAQMNGIAPVKAREEGWDGAAGLASPCPCHRQLQHFFFLIYLVLRISGMKLKITDGRCAGAAAAAPGRALALIWEYEINMRPLIPISCTLGSTGGFGTLRVGKIQLKELKVWIQGR